MLARADTASPGPSPELRQALATSGFVYVSPLLAGGQESRCHGEVWYGWLDDAVVVTTAATTWKARSLASGLRRARLWVGDYGPWKQTLGASEAFRQGPSFVARAERAEDGELLERLLAVYDRKYPDEIGRWRNRMRKGHAAGERILIRYVFQSS